MDVIKDILPKVARTAVSRKSIYENFKKGLKAWTTVQLDTGVDPDDIAFSTRAEIRSAIAMIDRLGLVPNLLNARESDLVTMMGTLPILQQTRQALGEVLQQPNLDQQAFSDVLTAFSRAAVRVFVKEKMTDEERQYLETLYATDDIKEISSNLHSEMVTWSYNQGLI